MAEAGVTVPSVDCGGQGGSHVLSSRWEMAALFCAKRCPFLALSDQKCLLCHLSFVEVGTGLPSSF